MLDELDGRVPPTRHSDHRARHIDPDHLDAVSSELDRNSTRSAPCVEDRAWVEASHQCCLAMDVDPLLDERIETSLVRRAIEVGHSLHPFA